MEDYRRRRLADAKQSGAVDEQRLMEMEAELRQQETLITGYQTENERIYSAMKQLRVAGKEDGDRMFKENLRLKAELANLK